MPLLKRGGAVQVVKSPTSEPVAAVPADRDAAGDRSPSEESPKWRSDEAGDVTPAKRARNATGDLATQVAKKAKATARVAKMRNQRNPESDYEDDDGAQKTPAGVFQLASGRPLRASKLIAQLFIAHLAQEDAKPDVHGGPDADADADADAVAVADADTANGTGNEESELDIAVLDAQEEYADAGDHI